MVLGENSTIIYAQVSSDFKDLLKRWQGEEKKELWGLGVEPQLHHF